MHEYSGKTIDLRLENRENDVIDAQVGARYTFNSNQYSLNPELSQDYVNRTFYSELNVYAGNGWRFTSGFDYALYADDVFGSAQNVPIWKAELSKLIMGEKGEIQLAGMDLLDRNLGVNYTKHKYIYPGRAHKLTRTICDSQICIQSLRDRTAKGRHRDD